MPENNFPKLHNATWPGIVGKGPDSEPPIDFDTMLKMTAAAEVNGVKFDGVDLGLLDPHININMTDDEIKKLAEKVSTASATAGERMDERDAVWIQSFEEGQFAHKRKPSG